MAGIATVFILLTAGFLIDRKQTAQKTDQNLSSDLSAETEQTEFSDSSTAYENKGDEDYSTGSGRPDNTDESKMETVIIHDASEDDICASVSEIIENTGRYTGAYEKAGFDDLHYAWQITDLSFNAGEDERYQNLYKYAMSISYADDVTETYANGSTYTYEEGDPAWCAAYVEIKDNGSAIIHKIVVDTDVLLDDNYVPRESA